MAANVPRWLPKWPPIDIRVISLRSKFQPHSSKNGYDMDIFKKSKMAAIFLGLSSQGHLGPPNYLKFQISTLQLFKWLRYGHLRIQNGCHWQTCQTKPTKLAHMGILDDFIHSSGIIFFLNFWLLGRQWCCLQMILSCWGDQ